VSLPAAPADVFAPVESHTAFEETLERLGTAIKLGLLEPGARLPAERELCARLGVSRSTLRQALSALVRSGHLRAIRGRTGGTFVADELPPPLKEPLHRLANWRETCDVRLAVEVGVAIVAAGRAAAGVLDALDGLVLTMADRLEDFPAFRRADVRLHVGLAEATGSGRLVAAMTETQGEMTGLIAHIAHPPEVLASSNAQHGRILLAIRRGDGPGAASEMTEHLQGTERVLAGLLPS